MVWEGYLEIPDLNQEVGHESPNCAIKFDAMSGVGMKLMGCSITNESVIFPFLHKVVLQHEENVHYKMWELSW